MATPFNLVHSWFYHVQSNENYIQHIFWFHACSLMSCLSERFLSKIPEKGSDSFFSGVVFQFRFRGMLETSHLTFLKMKQK